MKTVVMPHKLDNAERIDIVWVVYNRSSDQRNESYEECGAFIKDDM